MVITRSQHACMDIDRTAGFGIVWRGGKPAHPLETSGVLKQHAFQYRQVNLSQAVYVAHGNLFIDFVNGRIDRTEFDDMRAGRCDKAAVRCSATRG